MVAMANLSTCESERVSRRPGAAPGPSCEKTCDWAGEFRRLGLNPVPSRVDRKAPLVQHGWDPIDPELWDSLRRKGRPVNLQVMTGRAWGLVVVDLDGEAAIANWGPLPRTWISRSGSGKGLHLWFSVPREGGPIGGGPFWEGPGHHQEARLLGDRALVVAPPSIHPESGRPYAWLAGRHPLAIPLAPCPARVFLAIEEYRARQGKPRKPIARRYFSGGSPGENGIDALALAQQWGLRIHRGPDKDGWYTCHAIDREDRNPSARFHPENGSYFDFARRVSLSLPGLGHALGALSSDGREGWQEIRERFAPHAHAHARAKV